MTAPYPDPGSKVRHKYNHGYVLTYQGKGQDGWGDYHIMIDQLGRRLHVPTASLCKWEVVESVKQEGLEL